VFAKKIFWMTHDKKDILLFSTQKTGKNNRHLFVPRGTWKCDQDCRINSHSTMVILICGLILSFIMALASTSTSSRLTSERREFYLAWTLMEILRVKRPPSYISLVYDILTKGKILRTLSCY